MPIAHCFVSGQLTGSGDELIQNWAIQLALANSLGQYFSVPPEQVHVVTQVVESGYAVENGEIQRW